MIEKINISRLLELMREDIPIIDVRSPGEYTHARIPGAYSLPLFNDERAKVVGTAYKQESREKAIKIGVDFFGHKMSKMIEEVEEWVKGKPARTLLSIAGGEECVVPVLGGYLIYMVSKY